ncbi:MAG: hypothetical protein M0Z36_11010 [Thermaerobacter sp.]|nr:hypothetical protein [Thermaerobacter sp.]
MIRTTLMGTVSGLFLLGGALAGGGASVASPPPVPHSNQHLPNVTVSTSRSFLPNMHTSKPPVVRAPSPLDAAAFSDPVPLQALAMRTAQDGWAIGRDALLATTDGGRQWHTVTPPHVTIHDPGNARTGWFLADFGVAWDFVGPHSAWVATTISNRSGAFLLGHTTDSGKRWTQTRIQLPLTAYAWRGSQALQVDFVNNRMGWLAVGPGASGPQFPMELWQTANAGQSWHRVFATEAFGGAFAFTSPQDGWLLFQAPANNGILFALRHTTTAGRSWRTVPVPNLPGFANYMNGSAGTGLTWRGVDGALAGSTMQFGASQGYLAVLRTTDNGRQWAVSPQISAHSGMFVGVATAGASAWAVADGHLYTLSRQHQSWTLRTAAPWLAQATGLDAVNRGVTFIWQTTKRRTQIWRTTDGGVHWIAVDPTQVANS